MLYQQSIAEIAAQPATEEQRIYRPTPEDRAAGRYAALTQEVLDDGSPDWDSTIHMIPTFGMPHWVHSACWCSPIERRDPDYYEHQASQ